MLIVVNLSNKNVDLISIYFLDFYDLNVKIYMWLFFSELVSIAF